jgi:DNA-binding NarL/FixJ family response regulator
MPISILLADDQDKVRFALRVLLENRPDAEIVGEVVDAYELLERAPEMMPSAIILDWLLPGLSEIGSIEVVRELCPGAVIIALSGRPELEKEALENGADAFISKIDPPDRLQSVLDQITIGALSGKSKSLPPG